MTSDHDRILTAWPTLEPSPGFAERVLAAYDEPRARSRWPLYAVALAVLLLPLLALPRSHTPVAHVEDLDLGLRTD